MEEVTSFYKFVTNLHIPSSEFMQAPPDGWPSITPERYAWLEKDPAVIDLMRHLPYIYKEDYHYSYEIFPLTAVVDYNGPLVQSIVEAEQADKYAIEPMEEFHRQVPSYMLTLAAETSGADGCWTFVNTKEGTITLHDGNDSLGKGTVKTDVSFIADAGECGGGERVGISRRWKS